MLLQLVKKEFLIVKKYVLLMAAVCILFPIFLLWRMPEFAGIFGFGIVTVFSILMLLQYVSLKETQYPKASTLLCALPFSRKNIVLSRYIFCIVIYFSCCLIFGIESLLFPTLQSVGCRIPIVLFLLVSLCLSIYLPIQYKVGYEKTKLFFTVLITATPVGFAQLMKKGINLKFLSNIHPTLLLFGSLIISTMLLVISSILSIKIYSKTELA